MPAELWFICPRVVPTFWCACSGPMFAGNSGQRPVADVSSGAAAVLLAHFTRNLLGAQELTRTAKRFCREALCVPSPALRLWHCFRGDPHARGRSNQS